MSWAASFNDEEKIHYMDQRGERNIGSDKRILNGLIELIEKADILVGHNIDKFDRKKLNTRALINSLNPISKRRTVDTLKEAKKHFSMTSNKLEFLAKVLGLKNQKMKTKKFVGQELWTACLNRNRDAWDEMELYNKMDVIVLKEVYKRLLPWNDTIEFSIYNDENSLLCGCGSTGFVDNGFSYQKRGIFRKKKCRKCGANLTLSENLLSKDKKKLLRTGN